MSGIEPIAAPHSAQAQEQKQPQRYGGDFGGAVTHREVTAERLRVDPAAVAERMGADKPRQSGRQSVRQQRLAEEDAACEARLAQRPGARIDIEA